MALIITAFFTSLTTIIVIIIKTPDPTIIYYVIKIDLIKLLIIPTVTNPTHQILTNLVK